MRMTCAMIGCNVPETYDSVFKLRDKLIELLKEGYRNFIFTDADISSLIFARILGVLKEDYPDIRRTIYTISYGYYSEITESDRDYFDAYVELSQVPAHKDFSSEEMTSKERLALEAICDSNYIIFFVSNSRLSEYDALMNFATSHNLPHENFM